MRIIHIYFLCLKGLLFAPHAEASNSIISIFAIDLMSSISMKKCGKRWHAANDPSVPKETLSYHKNL